VIPESARAVVNHRIHASQTVADVIDFDKRVINDPRVEIKVLNSREAHPVSPFGPDDVQYHIIAKSVEQTFDNTPVSPGN
jgi:carboxypeptidase PM20D1